MHVCTSTLFHWHKFVSIRWSINTMFWFGSTLLELILEFIGPARSKYTCADHTGMLFIKTVGAPLLWLNTVVGYGFRFMVVQ